MSHSARFFLATAVLGLLGAGCGSTEIVLSVDKRKVTAGGIDHAVITATVVKGGEPTSGMKVSFETTVGAFGNPSGETEAEVTSDDKGHAEIQLHSSNEPATATVTASFYDEASGVEATGSISVEFVSAAEGSLPLGDKLRLDCDSVNIGALRDPVPDIRVKCQLTGETADGRIIPGSALSPTFRAEAGTLTLEVDDWTEERVIIYSPRGGPSAPQNVAPVAEMGEPSYGGSSGTRNPRDGLVTMMAIVDGQEGYKDVNGNNRYDRGEEFNDSPEPFLDANDDGQWNSGEYYLDLNNSRTWDAGNGMWDANTKIFAYLKILWTGALHNEVTQLGVPQTSRIYVFATKEKHPKLEDGSTIQIAAFALDRNLNPIAAHADNGDYLEWIYEGSEAQTSGETEPAMQNVYGFSFNRSADKELLRWRIEKDSFGLHPFKLTIKDRQSGDTRDPVVFTVSARTYTSAGRDGEGSFLTQTTERIAQTIQGTAD